VNTYIATLSYSDGSITEDSKPFQAESKAQAAEIALRELSKHQGILIGVLFGCFSLRIREESNEQVSLNN
jgi:hypothetical protein